MPASLFTEVYKFFYCFYKPIEMKKLFTIALLCVLVEVVVAQPYTDIFNYTNKYYPKRVLVHDQFPKMDIMEHTIDLMYPIILENENIIITGANYSNIHFSAADTLRYNLYETRLNLGYQFAWNKPSWKTLVMFLPRFRSDFEEISEADFQPGGLFLVSYAVNSTLTFKAGMFYNREFFGNYFMPLGGIAWQPTKKINVFGVMPGGMNVEYKILDRLYAQLCYRDITATYRLSDKYGTYYVRGGDDFWGDMNLHGILSFYPQKIVAINIGAGRTNFREFIIYNDQHEVEPIGELPLFDEAEDDWFITASVAIRIRNKDDQ